jgi:hypothetical protein
MAFQDTGSLYMIPTHYGVFRLTDTGYDQPVDDLKAAMQKYDIPKKMIQIVQPGQHWNVPETVQQEN